VHLAGGSVELASAASLQSTEQGDALLVRITAAEISWPLRPRSPTWSGSGGFSSTVAFGPEPAIILNRTGRGLARAEAPGRHFDYSVRRTLLISNGRPCLQPILSVVPNHSCPNHSVTCWRLSRTARTRRISRSLIITSQLPVDRWYELIGNPPLAGAILRKQRSSA
jgi:hypothetical protein